MTDAIEAGARAKAIVTDEMVERAKVAWLEHASDYTRLDVSIRAALEAAIASGALVPASAVAEVVAYIQERCAKVAETHGEPYALNTNTGAMMFRAVTDKIAKTIRDLEISPALVPTSVVKIKPLEWEQPDGPNGTAWIGHGTDMCQYYIRFDTETASYWMPGDRFRGNYDPAEEFLALDDAKASAQADYERRIRSALDLPPTTEGTPDTLAAVAEMRERCAALIDSKRMCATDPFGDGWNAAVENAVRRIRQLDLSPACGDYVVVPREVLTDAMEALEQTPDWDDTGRWSEERLARYETGQKHRAERIARGESQREAARRLNITLGQLTVLECGRANSPDPER